MEREPFIAHSELTNEIYIVVGKEKYRVTEQATKAVKAIKALEQQPNDDCVSRQAVLEKINDWWGITSTSGEPTLCDCIRELPPVTPTRKVGKWIFTKTNFDRHGCTVECSSCHKKWKTYDENRWEKENKYCPNCGAEMESEE